MSHSARRAPALRILSLVALAAFALAPLFGGARASTLGDEMGRLTATLEELRSRVRADELTDKGIRADAKRIIAMKRDFVLSAEQASGAFLEPYLDLARIDNDLEATKEDASGRRSAAGHLADAVAATHALADGLRGRSDAASYQEAITCLDGLEVAERDLAADIGRTPARHIRRRSQGLIDRKMECIVAWPPVFGTDFQQVYGLLRGIDEPLEGISDPRTDAKRAVVQAVAKAIEKAGELRRVIEAWEASATQSPGATHAASATPTRSASPSTSATPGTTPTPEESPTGINPQGPQVSNISAMFDPEAHRTVYSVTASDPDGDQLTFSWTKSNERECGSFTGNGPSATWNHQEPPCPEESSHPGTITVFVSDGTYTCSAFYDQGSAPGQGPPADCGLAPEP